MICAQGINNNSFAAPRQSSYSTGCVLSAAAQMPKEKKKTHDKN